MDKERDTRETVKKLAALADVDVAPGLEGLPGRQHGFVHVRLVSFSYADDFLARGRVEGGEGLARHGVNPFVVDEELGGTFVCAAHSRLGGEATKLVLPKNSAALSSLVSSLEIAAIENSLKSFGNKAERAE